jgi:hypothetical protein
MYLYEGGNVFDNTSSVAQADVATVVNTIKLQLPSQLQNKIIADIGSAGYKVESGDIDLFIDERAAVKNFDAQDAAGAKQALAQYFQAKGFQNSSQRSQRACGCSLHCRRWQATLCAGRSHDHSRCQTCG